MYTMWEYEYITNITPLETKAMNYFGALRYECFSVIYAEGEYRYYFKRLVK